MPAHVRLSNFADRISKSPSLALQSHKHARAPNTQPSTISNWNLEFVKWAPELRVIVFKGSPQERQYLSHEIKKGQFNVVLTTYEYVMREKATLGKVNWQYLIVDEGVCEV